MKKSASLFYHDLIFVFPVKLLIDDVYFHAVFLRSGVVFTRFRVDVLIIHDIV